MSLYNTPKTPSSQSIEGLFLFWKKAGETLAVMLRRFRQENGLDETIRLTYAGRLDPMAEGIVPTLVGEARFQKERFLKATKTYEVDILLGIGTDTGDMLGLSPVARHQDNDESGGLVSLDKITKALHTLSQTVSLPYPNYSSRPVDGKPLFMHARAGNEVVLPIKKVSIYELELVAIKKVPLGTLIEKAIATIETVQGDFRQKEIVEQWSRLAARQDLVTVVTLRTTVSSGTYMRALAEKLGLLLNVPALAYHIKRTAVHGLK